MMHDASKLDEDNQPSSCQGAMKPIHQNSLGDAIYARVRQDLVFGKLRPNQKVTIRGLADALGTGTTPVRDAVQRLLREDVLVQRSVRDVRVPMLTETQYLEITSIRCELEGLAAARAVEQVSAKDISSLKRNIARNEIAAASGRWSQAIEYNQQFHFALVEIAVMPVLDGILSRLWLQMGPLIAGYYAQEKVEMVRYHHAIVAACEARDPVAAAIAMRTDINSAREGILKYITTFTIDE